MALLLFLAVYDIKLNARTQLLVGVVTVGVIALFIFAVDTALSQLSARFIYGSVGKT